MSLGSTSVMATLPLNSVGDLLGIKKAVLRRREYHHEVCLLSTENQKSLGLRTGDPIIITMQGAAGGVEEFIGYIDHIRAESTAAAQHTKQTLVCVGPTWYMQQPRQHVWKNKTISDIARKICADHNLTIDCENSSLRITINQAGQSDWAFLCRIAKTYGYVVYCEQTTVHFVSRTRDLNKKMATSQLLVYSEHQRNVASQIYSFKPILGDTKAVKGRVGRVLQTVDPVTHNVVSAYDDGTPDTTAASHTQSNAAVFDTFIPGVAQSPADAAARVTGGRDANMWTYHAKASVRGAAGTTPTSMFYFDNLDGDWDGYWVVTSMDHTFELNHNDEMLLEVGANSLGPPVSNYKPGTVQVLQTVQANIPVPKAYLTQQNGQVDISLLTKRGGPNNPLRWVGSIASLDPKPGEKRISAAALRRLRRNG